MGPLNLKPKEFWSLTWADFHRMAEGYRFNMDKQWEIARWQVCAIFNTKLKKGAAPIKPTDILKLSIDREIVSPPIKQPTKEELFELKRKMGLIKNG